MFCHKCGAQIVEGAAFCPKCGTKVVHEDAAHLTERGAVSISPVAAAPIHSPNTVTNKDNFMEFVDNHIHATTQFQSVEDLINNSKPMKFAWICLGALSLVGLILGAINLGGAVGALVGLLLVGGFLGHTCLIKTVPIMQAAIKFYLNQNTVRRK